MDSTWGYKELLGQVIVDGLYLLRGELVDNMCLDDAIIEQTLGDDYNSVYKYFTYDGLNDMQDFLRDNWEEAEKVFDALYRDKGEVLTADWETDVEKKIYTFIDYELQEVLGCSRFLLSNVMREVTLTDDMIKAMTTDLGLERVERSNWTYKDRER